MMVNQSSVDFSRLHIRTTAFGHDHLLVRPGITLTFFVDEPLAVTCAAAADLIERLFSWIPRATFRSFLAKDGFYKPLTDRQVAKDLKALRNLPPKYKGYELRYSDAELGNVGDYGILVEAVEPSASRPDMTNLVRLEFPEDILRTWGEQVFLQRVTEAAESLPFSSGHSGFAFKRSTAFEPASWQAIIPLLPRYIGFDPSDHWLATRMRGYSLTSAWINLLGSRLTEKLSGLPQLRAQIGKAETKALRNGTWIRGARFPPIGDVNRGASDIGELPLVARLLRPIRCPNPRSGDRHFDAAAWFARFDDLTPKEWDNS